MKSFVLTGPPAGASQETQRYGYVRDHESGELIRDSWICAATRAGRQGPFTMTREVARSHWTYDPSDPHAPVDPTPAGVVIPVASLPTHASDEVARLQAEVERLQAERTETEAWRARWDIERQMADHLAKVASETERERDDALSDAADLRWRLKATSDAANGSASQVVRLQAEVERLTAESEKRIQALIDVRASREEAAREVERLRAQRDLVLTVIGGGYHDASRWENPLPVPSWVVALRLAIDATDAIPCDCGQCAGAEDRRARDRREAGLS